MTDLNQRFYGGPQPESYTFQIKNFACNRNLTHRVKVLSEHEIVSPDNTAVTQTIFCSKINIR